MVGGGMGRAVASGAGTVSRVVVLAVLRVSAPRAARVWRFLCWVQLPGRAGVRPVVAEGRGAPVGVRGATGSPAEAALQAVVGADRLEVSLPGAAVAMWAGGAAEALARSATGAVPWGAALVETSLRLQVGLPVAGLVLPGLRRSLAYWSRFVPIMGGYIRKKLSVKRRHARGTLAKGAATDDEWEVHNARAAKDVYAMLTHLGGFYLKIGQVIATKQDFVPSSYAVELGRLLDAVEAAPWTRVERKLRRELGAAAYARLEVDPTPLACATVAQVHRARITDVPSGGKGAREVVLKVQHSGMRTLMSRDLRNMRVSTQVTRWVGLDPGFDDVSVMKEYEQQVPLEFDFRREVRIQEQCREACAGLPGLYIPRCELALSGDQVICMEYVEGERLSTLFRELAAGQRDPASLAGLSFDGLVHAYGRMMFELGVFQSDPHPGNMLLLPDGRGMCLLDFGESKVLQKHYQVRFAALVDAIADGDEARIGRTLDNIGFKIRGAHQSMKRLIAEQTFDTASEILGHTITVYDRKTGAEVQRRLDTAGDLFGLMADHPVENLPTEIFMVVRVIALLNGMFALLGVKGYSVCKVWQPYARKLLGRGPAES